MKNKLLIALLSLTAAVMAAEAPKRIWIDPVIMEHDYVKIIVDRGRGGADEGAQRRGGTGEGEHTLFFSFCLRFRNRHPAGCLSTVRHPPPDTIHRRV